MEIKPLQIHFFPKKKTSSNQYSLYMRMNLGNQRCDISLKYELERDAWDDQQHKLKGRNSDQPRLTGLMNQFRHRAMTIHQELIQQGLSPTIFEIRERLNGSTKNTGSGTGFFELFDKVIERKKILSGENNSPATIQKYRRCKAHISDFIRSTFNQSDLRFDQVNLNFLEDFEIYLKTKGNCEHNSAMKYIQTLRTIFKTACAHGYTKNDPFSKYKIRLREVVRDYLNQEEIDKLIKVDLPSEKLEKVRDLFVFSCYTGLAYADIHGLKAKNIQLEHGQYWIRTRRQKTNVRTNVPLLNIPLKLIEKYNDDIAKIPEDNPVFKVMSNQKVNDYLKVLASFCGITKVLTFHIARHTFATTVTLSNGVPIESVSAMLGHKRIATTQHYAKMVDKKLEEDMRRLAERLGQ
jgi:site-specific recombinase XerD